MPDSSADCKGPCAMVSTGIFAIEASGSDGDNSNDARLKIRTVHQPGTSLILTIKQKGKTFVFSDLTLRIFIL